MGLIELAGQEVDTTSEEQGPHADVRLRLL
jgi:hypothetical protein